MRAVLLAAIAGVGLFLAFPPGSQAYLAVPAMVLLLWAVRQTHSWRHAALAGLVFGLSFFGVLFPWLTELGLIAFVPLWIVQSIYPMLFALVLYSVRGAGPLRWWAVAVGGWAATEAIRGRFPLGGFEWGFLGYPAGEYTVTRDVTQWIGTTGWSVAIVAVAAAAVVAIEHRRYRLLGWSLAVVLALVAGGLIWPATSDGPVVRVAMVQGSTPCPGTHCVGERRQTYETHLALTNRLEPGSVDLVVWAESSSGGSSADPIGDPDVREEMGAAARRLGAVLIAGTDHYLSDTEWINANVVFDEEGTLVGEYRKRHPVPFGEYVPMRSWFGWVQELDAVPRDMKPGDGPVVFSLDIGEVGSVVSWEGSFARYPFDEVKAGAQLLVVATNQGSYPYSYATDQFIGMTRMRSAELGTDVIHIGVVGRSVLITDSGHLGATTGIATSEVLVGDVQLRTAGPTLYVRLGNWVQWLAILAGAWFWPRRPRGLPATTDS